MLSLNTILAVVAMDVLVWWEGHLGERMNEEYRDSITVTISRRMVSRRALTGDIYVHIYSSYLMQHILCCPNKTVVVSPQVAVAGKLSGVTAEHHGSWYGKQQLNCFMLLISQRGVLRHLCTFFLMQHWLEFTKSIAKQMKCEYFDFMSL